MISKGQKLRLKRAMWGHKPGTVGKVTKTHEPTPVNAYTAQVKFKSSPKMSVADKDLDDLLEPVPESLSEGKHKPGCQCGFCKNKGRGFAKKTETPAEPAEPAKAEEPGDKMESWLPEPPGEDQPMRPPGLNAGQVKAALLHDEFPVAEAVGIERVGKRRTQCECADPKCPQCRGQCTRSAVTNLRRVDMEDVTGTMMCHGCASDALESGLFREDIGAKIKYR